MRRPRIDSRVELQRALAVFAIVTLVGALGYYAIERTRDEPWTLLESLYMAVIIVSTVGLREVHQLDPPGQLFTIILIFFGVTSFMYLATTLASYVIAGELQGYWSRRRMEKKIDQLSDHYIVCAYGRMGSEVADEFRREKRPVVVIDTDHDALERASDHGFYTLEGSAKDDETLKNAGVARARGLVSCLDSDADNLMVVLSARELNEKLLIVSRTNQHETSSKLMAAGANRVLWPYGLSGRRMAQMALRPNVVEFLEIVMHDEDLELLMEELTIAIGSPLDGQPLSATPIRAKSGAMLVAVRRRDGKMIVAPPADTALSAGDIIVALGTRAQLEKLHELTHPA